MFVNIVHHNIFIGPDFFGWFKISNWIIPVSLKALTKIGTNWSISFWVCLASFWSTWSPNRCSEWLAMFIFQALIFSPCISIFYGVSITSLIVTTWCSTINHSNRGKFNKLIKTSIINLFHTMSATHNTYWWIGPATSALSLI